MSILKKSLRNSTSKNKEKRTNSCRTLRRTKSFYWTYKQY